MYIKYNVLNKNGLTYVKLNFACMHLAGCVCSLTMCILRSWRLCQISCQGKLRTCWSKTIQCQRIHRGRKKINLSCTARGNIRLFLLTQPSRTSPPPTRSNSNVEQVTNKTGSSRFKIETFNGSVKINQGKLLKGK